MHDFNWFVMRLHSKQSFKVVYWVLKLKVFSQTELAEKAMVSWGQMNKVVQWLIKKGFVRKGAKYELVNPAALVQLLTTEVELEKDSFEVSVPKKIILDWIKKHEQVLCLNSALDFYSNYFRDPGISVCFSKELKEYLANAQPGLTKVTLVKSNLELLPSNIIKKNGFFVTNEVRTIIDLFADKKAYAVEPLIKKVF